MNRCCHQYDGTKSTTGSRIIHQIKTSADIIREIRVLVNMPEELPDSDLVEWVHSWGIRREADGIIDARRQLSYSNMTQTRTK